MKVYIKKPVMPIRATDSKTHTLTPTEHHYIETEIPVEQALEVLKDVLNQEDDLRPCIDNCDAPNGCDCFVNKAVWAIKALEECIK